MGVPHMCACQGVLLALGVRQKELNDQVWSQLKGKGISWAEMQTALEQLVAKGLATQESRRVEGRRLTFFYTLTAKGQKLKTSLLSGEEENGNATDCGENCCITQAA